MKVYKTAMKYYFPFIGNDNLKQFLKFSEAYHPLDYLTLTVIDHIKDNLNNTQGPIKHVLERLINWLEKNVLGKVHKFEELEKLLYVHKRDEEAGPRGINELIESMIPYRYYEALSGDDIADIRKSAIKIYKDGIDAALSMAMDKPSLMPTQVYEKNETKMPEFKEDYLTPWLQGSDYERI